MSIKLLLLHGCSEEIGPNADTTISEDTENKSDDLINLPGRLVLEISMHTIYVHGENGNRQLHATAITSTGDT